MPLSRDLQPRPPPIEKFVLVQQIPVYTALCIHVTYGKHECQNTNATLVRGNPYKLDNSAFLHGPLYKHLCSGILPSPVGMLMLMVFSLLGYVVM